MRCLLDIPIDTDVGGFMPLKKREGVDEHHEENFIHNTTPAYATMLECFRLEG